MWTIPVGNLKENGPIYTMLLPIAEHFYDNLSSIEKQLTKWSTGIQLIYYTFEFDKLVASDTSSDRAWFLPKATVLDSLVLN